MSFPALLMFLRLSPLPVCPSPHIRRDRDAGGSPSAWPTTFTLSFLFYYYESSADQSGNVSPILRIDLWIDFLGLGAFSTCPLDRPCGATTLLTQGKSRKKKPPQIQEDCVACLLFCDKRKRKQRNTFRMKSLISKT